MMLRIRSVQEPFDEPEVARASLELLTLLEAMGLLDEPVERLDLATLRNLAVTLGALGVGSTAAATLARQTRPKEVRMAIQALRDALVQSPVPSAEWPALIELFGADRLSALVGVSAPSVRRYASGARPTPDAVAARLHHLARIVAHLRGAYNDFGVRRWFDRSRSRLDGRSPAQLLRGRWQPDATGPGRVAELARDLVSSPAT